MTTKLPEGVPVYILDNNKIIDRTVRPEEANGTVMTYADRLERDKAIARAIWEIARCQDLDRNGQMRWRYQAGDYLQSEEFKKLVGER